MYVQVQSEMVGQVRDQAQRAEIMSVALNKERKERQKLLNRIIEIEGNIRVFCRVRPNHANEEVSLSLSLSLSLCMCVCVESPDILLAHVTSC